MLKNISSNGGHWMIDVVTISFETQFACSVFLKDIYGNFIESMHIHSVTSSRVYIKTLPIWSHKSSILFSWQKGHGHIISALRSRDCYIARDHTGYVLSQWGMTLHSKVDSHWLSSYSVVSLHWMERALCEYMTARGVCVWHCCVGLCCGIYFRNVVRISSYLL